MVRRCAECLLVLGSLADVHEVPGGLVRRLHQHQLQFVHKLGVLGDRGGLAAGGRGRGQRGGQQGVGQRSVASRGGLKGCGQQGVGRRGVASRGGSEGCGQQGWVEGVWPARGRVKRYGSEEKDQMRTYNVTEGKCTFSSQGHNRPRPSVCMSVCVSVTMQCALTCLPGSQGGVCWRVVSLGLAVGCGGPVRHGPTDYWREGHISCIHSQ